MTELQVTVRYRDDALAGLVADAARRVPGVVSLQRRPGTATVGRVGAAVRGRSDSGEADTSAVELSRDAGGALEVAVRLVSTLRPSPVVVIAAVADAVTGRLAEVGEGHVRVEVTVTDVRIPVR